MPSICFVERYALPRRVVFAFFRSPANVVAVRAGGAAAAPDRGAGGAGGRGAFAVEVRRFGLARRIDTEVRDDRGTVAHRRAAGAGAVPRVGAGAALRRDRGRTELTETITYEPPGGMLGLMLTPSAVEAELRLRYQGRAERVTARLGHDLTGRAKSTRKSPGEPLELAARHPHVGEVAADLEDDLVLGAGCRRRGRWAGRRGCRTPGRPPIRSRGRRLTASSRVARPERAAPLAGQLVQGDLVRRAQHGEKEALGADQQHRPGDAPAGACAASAPAARRRTPARARAGRRGRSGRPDSLVTRMSQTPAAVEDGGPRTDVKDRSRKL